jgi:RecA/RadA recombinase
MSAEALSKALLSAIGENSDDQGVTEYISTGFLPLNNIISGSYQGGIPQGRLIEMFGPPSCGKTALATMALIQTQKAGGIAGFMDHERSFDVSMARNMGLNDEFPYWIYKHPATWEESNTAMVRAAMAIRESKVISENAPILFVFDSVASAIPKSMLDKDFNELTMNDTSALSRVSSTTL